jgi:polyisoprenoid-binding protein YceI
MKQLSFVLVVAVTMLLSAFTIYHSMDWQIAEGYSIKFDGKGASGVFKTMSGAISFDESDLSTAKFSVSIDVASINTGNGLKNKHAKSEKWLDAKKYPFITFTSTKFSKIADGYQVEGTLEMHGKKKEVVIPFTFSSNLFKGSFKVNRVDYGVGDTKGMSKMVANEMSLEISVPVIKK